MNEPGRDLPPEFDLDCYRASNPDLAHLTDDQLPDHFHAVGADEGRKASPVANRAAFVADLLGREQGRILEIGPFADPLIRGNKVRYHDAVPTEVLRARAAASGLSPGLVPRIHYVGEIDALARSFDAAVAGRSIGRHPDLIRHLEEVARVLVDGGRYFLVVPDRRFTSALALANASVAEMVAAHREGRRRHTLATVIADRALRYDGDAGGHSGDDRESASYDVRARKIGEVCAAYDRAPDDIDAEAWHFTPRSWRDCMELLFATGLSPFRPVRVWSTPSGADEFCTILEKADR